MRRARAEEEADAYALRQGGKAQTRADGRVTHLQKYVQVMAETSDGDEPRKAHSSREHNGGEGAQRGLVCAHVPRKGSRVSEQTSYTERARAQVGSTVKAGMNVCK